ncbi:MAG: hypothetical protein JWM80_3737 [Cyanobacteria bacterium RYN_339]|nr:hypothetical protein [Cyanobacteria bacterium RYN_339]
MRRLGILVTLAVLTAGCGASRSPLMASAVGSPVGFDALATAKSTAYDDLTVAPAADDARACKCSAVTATNEKFTIGLQADGDKLVAVSVNGKFLVEHGAWANSKGKEDLDAAAAQAQEIDDMLADESSKAADKAKVASRALTLARIYSGLQKAKAETKARTAFTDVKKAMRVFIKANSPSAGKDKGQIGV